MINKLRILMVEDVDSDAELIKYEIRKSGIQFTEMIVTTQDEYINALNEFKPEFILSDYILPSFNGMQALRIRQQMAPDIPFILVTGSMNEETAVEVMKAGADDYVIKEHITRIGTAIKTSLEKRDIIRMKIEAEEKLRILSRAVEQNPASIVITGTDGNIEYVNSKFTWLTGYGFGEVIGKNPRILKSGTASPDEYRQLWETILSGQEWHGEFQNQKKNGEIYFEAASISPIIDEKGSITHFLALKEDITERKLSERKIKTLRLAIEQSPSSIIITNAEGKIEFVNTKFTKQMQYTLDEVAGKNPRIFNPGHQTNEVHEFMWRNLHNGNSWQGEFLNRKKDGTLFWENVIIAPLLEESGRLSNYILVSEDITEKKKMVNDLMLAKEKAEESDRLKTAFLHNISHEIRTPMNAIVGFSEFLNDPGLLPEKRKFFTSIIIQSSEQLLSIITDIINIATIEAGQEIIHEKEINLNSLCELIYEQYITVSKNQGIELSYTYTLTGNDAIVISDETKLKQVLGNLVSNALKFTTKGHVRFGYTVKNNFLEFYTEDTGIGVSPELHEEIFKRFRQAEYSAARHFGGSGLGLSISKAYVELLGGKIWLTSETGKGSIFYFTIPFRKAITDTDTENMPMRDEKIKFKKCARLLVAEDDDSNFLLLKEIFSDLEIGILRAVNGTEAVEIVRSNSIDMVLMDIKMPEMDGYEATRKIKSLAPALPVIAQTAYNMNEEREKAMQAGCDGYITKPVKKSELMAVIKKHCK